MTYLFHKIITLSNYILNSNSRIIKIKVISMSRNQTRKKGSKSEKKVAEEKVGGEGLITEVTEPEDKAINTMAVPAIKNPCADNGRRLNPLVNREVQCEGM